MNTMPVGNRLSSVAQHSIGNRTRAAVIARSLKDIAKKARSPASIWVPSPDAPHASTRRWHRSLIHGVVIGFVALVLLPVLISGAYLAFIASDQYASETRFAVRGGDRTVMDSLGMLAGLQSSQRIQDALIVADYVRGRAIVEDLERTVNLRQLYARSFVDYLSKFSMGDSIEELVYYWRRRTDVGIDPQSGIITVVVRAFTPEDSLAIAKGIIALSEKLVNNLSERSRDDALRQARSELNRAESNLRDKARALSELRNIEGILDANKSAEAATKLVSELRLDLIRMEQEYSSQIRSVAPTAPQVRVLNERIVSMREQIRHLESQMTNTETRSSTTLANAMSRLDRQKFEQEIAEKQYVAASVAYERARVEMETQQVYLASFMQPVLAQESLYPKRTWIWSIILVGGLALWGAGVGLAVLVRNYLAV